MKEKVMTLLGGGLVEERKKGQTPAVAVLLVSGRHTHTHTRGKRKGKKKRSTKAVILQRLPLMFD